MLLAEGSPASVLEALHLVNGLLRYVYPHYHDNCYLYLIYIIVS